mmetsp:Transcript_22074/g.32047  ORF Transcript_22074/g.32047 Transcript_22074/m.32047 type:complete len:205 (-) Transcript_22074:117-731(-)
MARSKWNERFFLVIFSCLAGVATSMKQMNPRTSFCSTPNPQFLHQFKKHIFCAKESKRLKNLRMSKICGKEASSKDGVHLIRRKWACISNCGACCKLSPAGFEYLDRDEDKKILEDIMTADGWCKHFDQEQKICQIYEHRPWFCRTDDASMYVMFGIDDEEEADEFCTSCCQENIKDSYGDESEVLERFKAVIASLEDGGSTVE